MSAQSWSRSRSSKRSKGNDAKLISITAVVSNYGGEVKEGRAANVKCVMHNDSRSSAVINTYENLYFCHTCGKGGNAVNIVMEMESLGFKDALKRAIEIDAGSGQSVRGSNRRGNARVSKRTWNL